MKLLGLRQPKTDRSCSDLLLRRHWLLAPLAVIGFAAAYSSDASATSQSRALPTLVTAGQVHSLASKEAARGYPVHLKGVVTFFDASLNHLGYCPTFVHDDTGDIYVKVVFGLDKGLPVGSLIDLRGVSEAGEFAPVIAGARIKVIGHSGLPTNPTHPGLARLLSGTEDGRWIEEEGVIHSVVETDVGVEKLVVLSRFLGPCKWPGSRVAILLCSYAFADVGDSVGRLRNRTSRLMFWAVAARKNCSRTNLNRRSRSRWRPMWLRLFSSAKSASTFFR